MKLSGPVVSALIHGAVFAGVVFLVKSEGRLPTPIIAIFADPEPQRPPAAEVPKAVTAPKPKAGRSASRPSVAPPAARAPSAPPPTPTGPAGPAPMDLGLLLEGEGEGEVPSGAVVLPSSMVGPGGAGGRPSGPPSPGSLMGDAAGRRGSACDEEPLAPEPLQRVAVEYPLDAPAVAGKLTARLHVGPDGSVSRVEVTQSVAPEVDRAAIRSLERWRFRPGRRCGAAVAASYVVVLNFELAE